MKHKRLLQSGFTLIELLVVIAIIGILASTVLASLQDARLSTQYTAAKQEMKLISDALIVAGQPGQEIRLITGSNCTRCICGSYSDLRVLPDSNACVVRLRTSLQNIANQTVLLNETEELVRDPWGSPYQLDENEGEVIGGDPCRIDHLATVGPDGERGTADDYIVFLPYRTGQCN